jgi:hypothetical protein
MYIRDEDKLDPEFFDESEMPSRLPQVSGPLVKDIFKATAKQVLKHWDGMPVTEVVPEWHFAVMRQIWLWYDYCSLPQRQIREKRPGLQPIFEKTLEHLPELQRRCHSLALNSSLKYSTRAWCVSEYIGMDANLFGGRTEYGHLITQYERMSTFDQVPFRAFELLVDPTVSFEQVLQRIGLAFTNNEHNENCVRPICWILWNSVLRRKMFFYDYFYSFEGSQPSLLVGIGRPSRLVKWLEYMSLALDDKNAFETDASVRKPFFKAVQSGDDILDYDIIEWEKAREDAFDRNPDGLYQDLVVPCIDKDDDKDPNAICDSIKAALERIQIALQSDDDVYYRVYIEEKGKRKKGHPHFSLLFYDLERY